MNQRVAAWLTENALLVEAPLFQSVEIRGPDRQLFHPEREEDHLIFRVAVLPVPAPNTIIVHGGITIRLHLQRRIPGHVRNTIARTTIGVITTVTTVGVIAPIARTSGLHTRPLHAAPQVTVVEQEVILRARAPEATAEPEAGINSSFQNQYL